ncbi:MAG: SAM-dependent DNA methyltransferase, partial [Thermomicrobiales bacterium]
ADDGLDPFADPEGIVCLPSIYQEAPAHQRQEALLRKAYGDAWSPDLLPRLLKEVEATSLEAWLRDKKGFFAQHVRLFHNRPFLWQITDGLKDGFSAIVNYHRLDARALSKLIHTYLGDWISRQQRAVDAGEAGAPARLEAATALRAKLIAIADGESPYDVYVRWKSLAEQPIGWNPDLNDGVRLNIRPFIDAGVLASKVTVNWNKDRGKDPEARTEQLAAGAAKDLVERIALHASVDRHNDLHFAPAEKERARALVTKAETGA